MVVQEELVVQKQLNITSNTQQITRKITEQITLLRKEITQKEEQIILLQKEITQNKEQIILTSSEKSM